MNLAKKNFFIISIILIMCGAVFYFDFFKIAPSTSTDIIHRGNSIEPSSLDPHLTVSLNEANIQRDVFEGLTAESEDGSIIPGVAERWETSPNKLKWTFFLRKNAKWTNGESVTAHDFVSGLRRVVEPKTASAYAFLLKPIMNANKIITGIEKDLTQLGVRAIDDYTLEINLETPVPHLLNMMAHHVAYPFLQKVYDQHGVKWTQAKNIVSNGPYKLTEWVPQSHIKLMKSEFYWDAKSVKTSTIFYYPTEDREAELKRFLAGELHTTESIPQHKVDWIAENMKTTFRNTPYPGIVFYAFNMTVEPFKSNLKLRQALTLAVNRQLITDNIVKRSSIPAYTWIPKGMGTYDSQMAFFGKMTQEEREKKAKDLFAEAGFSAKNPLKLEVLYNTNDGAKNLTIALADMWKTVLGVEVTLRNEEWKVFLNSKSSKKFQLIRVGGVADFPIASAFLENFCTNSGTQNTPGYANIEFDHFVEAALIANTEQERNALFARAETCVLNDLPVIPIYHSTTRHLVNENIKGWTDNFMDVHPSRYLQIINKK